MHIDSLPLAITGKSLSMVRTSKVQSEMHASQPMQVSLFTEKLCGFIYFFPILSWVPALLIVFLKYYRIFACNGTIFCSHSFAWRIKSCSEML